MTIAQIKKTPYIDPIIYAKLLSNLNPLTIPYTDVTIKLNKLKHTTIISKAFSAGQSNKENNYGPYKSVVLSYATPLYYNYLNIYNPTSKPNN